MDVKQYNLLLDYPDSENPNLVKIFNGTEEIFRSHYKEDTLHEGDNHPDFVNSFLAYSAAGNATGKQILYLKG